MMIIDGYCLDDFYQVDDLTSKIYNHIIYIYNNNLVVPTPLKNDGVRQLG